MTLTVFQPKSNRKTATVTMEVVAAVLLHSSFWATLFQMLGLSFGVIPVLAMIGLPVLFYFLSQIKVFGRYLIFYGFLLMALLFLVGFRFFSKAFLELYNELVLTLDLTQGKQILTMATDVPEGKEPFYAGCGATLIMVLTSTVFATSARYRKTLAQFLVTMVPLLLFLLIGFTPNLILFSWFLLSLTLSLLLCAGLHEGNVGQLSNYLWEFLLVFLAFLIVFSFAFLHYDSSKAVKNFQSKISHSIYEWRYAPEEKIDGMPEGNLNTAGALQLDGTEVLKVTLSEPEQEPLYLRSFVGETFLNGAWSSVSSEAQEETTVKRKLAYTAADYSSYTVVANWATSGDWDSISMTVENVSEYADKIYAPYEIVYTEDLANQAERTDTGFLTFGLHGKRSYEVELVKTDLLSLSAQKRSQYAKSKGSDEVRKGEELYSEYAKAQYLSVDAAYATTIESLKSAWIQEKSADEVTQSIRRLFSESFTYSEDALTNGAEDPLIYFATQGRSGYDAHFASLATLLYRSAGIPARYVEGYLLPVGATSYEVTDTNSHAWVEIYEEGFGWVPVEVTPGYYASTVTRQNTTTASLVEEKEENQSSEEEETGFTLPVVWKVLLILLAIVLVFFGILLLGQLLLKQRIRRAATAKDVYLGYRYLLLLYRLKRRAPDWTAPKMAAYRDLIYKEKYSAKGLTLEERRQAANLVLQLLKK